MSYRQPNWVGVGWLPNGTRVALSGNALKGIKRVAADHGCEVIRVYNRMDGPSRTTMRFLRAVVHNRGVWVRFGMGTVDLMARTRRHPS